MDIKNELSKKLAVVIFSKNRPLQLELLIKTFFVHCEEWVAITETVLYKADNERYENAYKKLAELNPETNFVRETNFKEDLLKLIDGKEYVLFLVDDTIFTHDFSLTKIYDALEKYKGAIGFSLRLGKNTTYCYSLNMKQQLPEIVLMTEDDFMAFKWNTNSSLSGDFAYPLELSSSVYRVQDILFILRDTNYGNPNDLEWNMACLTHYLKTKEYLISYCVSRAFSNPLNKVQTVNTNRSGNEFDFSPESLLEKFEDGYLINGTPFYKLVPEACHQELPFQFLNYKEGIRYNIKTYVPGNYDRN